MKTSRFQQQSALTLIDVLVVIVCLFVLVALLLPALAASFSHAAQVNCVSNLKQVGLGWLVWIHDHESGNLPFRVSVTNGGTFGTANPAKNEAWWQYCVISNALGSPKVLVCPFDKKIGLS